MSTSESGKNRTDGEKRKAFVIGSSELIPDVPFLHTESLRSPDTRWH